MSKLKNRITAYINDNLKHEDQFDNIKSKLNLQNKSTEGKYYFMKKRNKFKFVLPCLVLLLCVVFGVVLLTNNSLQTEAKPVAVVQMDVNPSISFVIDDNNKVVSVYGENDEGKMIIINEEIIGLSLELAIEKVIKIENEAGYLITGNIETEKNNISFKIESDNENIVKEIETKINSCVVEICDELNIQQNINIIKAQTKEELVKRAMELDPTLTLDEANSKTTEQLILYISGCQLEKINIPTEQLEQLYNNFKTQQIRFVEKEETKKFIDSLDSTYQTFIENYDKLYNSLITAQQQLNDQYIKYFINETSTYQQALIKFQEQKLEVLKLENEVANMEDSPNKIILEQTLKTKKFALEAQLKSLELAKEATDKVLQLANETINYVLVKMDEFKSELPEEIKTKMNENLEDLENKINETKDNILSEFESKYKNQIEAAYNNSKQYKEKLIDQLKN